MSYKKPEEYYEFIHNNPDEEKPYKRQLVCEYGTKREMFERLSIFVPTLDQREVITEVKIKYTVDGKKGSARLIKKVAK